MEIYDMMALGYPAIEPAPKLLKDKAQTVHYDDCGIDDFRTDKEGIYSECQKSFPFIPLWEKPIGRESESASRLCRPQDRLRRRG